MAVQPPAALADAGLTAADIDLLIVATITPDLPMPATACIIQHKLGVPDPRRLLRPERRLLRFHLRLDTACAMLASGRYRTPSSSARKNSLPSWIGRTAPPACSSAMAPAPWCSGPRPSPTSASSAPSSAPTATACDLLCIPGRRQQCPATPLDRRRRHFMKMKGKEVFKLAVRAMDEAARDILEQHHLRADQIRPRHPSPGEPAHHRGHFQYP
jgi:3-oxoacyl-[acyl-carrier-protein] synthase-3